MTAASMMDEFGAPPPDDGPVDTVRVFITGFVQGVNFRRWLQGEAQSRNIRGWARNREDGRVEAIFQGASHQVTDLLRACRHGPDLARVDGVHSEPAVYDGLEGFRIVESE